MIKDTVMCRFDEDAPKYVHVHFVRDVTMVL